MDLVSVPIFYPPEENHVVVHLSPVKVESEVQRVIFAAPTLRKLTVRCRHKPRLGAGKGTGAGGANSFSHRRHKILAPLLFRRLNSAAGSIGGGSGGGSGGGGNDVEASVTTTHTHNHFVHCTPFPTTVHATPFGTNHSNQTTNHSNHTNKSNTRPPDPVSYTHLTLPTIYSV